MTSAQITTAANQIIDGFDSNAHTAITLWRDGHDKLAAAARQRWDAAFKEASPELSAETRRNAQNARKVIGGYYTRAVTMSASGAEVAVDTVVQAARTAVERAAAWQQSRA
jgi:hypothetical protein